MYKSYLYISILEYSSLRYLWSASSSFHFLWYDAFPDDQTGFWNKNQVGRKSSSLPKDRKLAKWRKILVPGSVRTMSANYKYNQYKLDTNLISTNNTNMRNTVDAEQVINIKDKYKQFLGKTAVGPSGELHQCGKDQSFQLEIKRSDIRYNYQRYKYQYRYRYKYRYKFKFKYKCK